MENKKITAIKEFAENLGLVVTETITEDEDQFYTHRLTIKRVEQEGSNILAVINIIHDHHEVPSPVDRAGISSWHFIYHKPKPVVEEQEDWFMNIIIRDLDRDLLGK